MGGGVQPAVSGVLRETRRDRQAGRGQAGGARQVWRDRAGGTFPARLHLPVHLVNWGFGPVLRMRPNLSAAEDLSSNMELQREREREASPPASGVLVWNLECAGDTYFQFFCRSSGFGDSRAQVLLRWDTSHTGGPGGRAGWASTYEAARCMVRP